MVGAILGYAWLASRVAPGQQPFDLWSILTGPAGSRTLTIRGLFLIWSAMDTSVHLIEGLAAWGTLAWHKWQQRRQGGQQAQA